MFLGGLGLTGSVGGLPGHQHIAGVFGDRGRVFQFQLRAESGQFFICGPHLVVMGNGAGEGDPGAGGEEFRHVEGHPLLLFLQLLSQSGYD